MVGNGGYLDLERHIAFGSRLDLGIRVNSKKVT